MVHENRRHRSAGSARKSSFTTSLRRHSSGSFLSRVLGSFRHKHHEEKGKKTSAQEKEERQDWMANYKGTHHPDRPRVDKRTQEMVSDEEYAARLGWIRKRSDHNGPSQSPVPNFSYSSTSPRSNRMSSVSPTFTTKTGKPFGDWVPSRGNTTTDPVLVSPVLPGVGAIRTYNAGALDRGPIIRYSEGPEKRGHPPPRKISASSHPSKRRGSRGSMLGGKRTAADIEITNLPDREPRTTIYDASLTSEHAPGLILNSSPISPSAQTCPWRGCHAVLITAQEKEDNLCNRCREALFPRESAFFGPYPPVIQDAHLETLQALTGSVTTTNIEHTQAQTIRRRPTGLDKRSSAGGFKLLPAPRGKRRDIVEAQRKASNDNDVDDDDDDDDDDEDEDSSNSSEKESGNQSDESAWSTFSPYNKQRTSPRIQDAGPFSPLHEGIFGTSPRSAGIRFSRGDGSRTYGKQEDVSAEAEAEPLSPHTKAPSDKSWTTDMHSTSSDSDEPLSPYSDPDMEIVQDLYPPPLIARIQSTGAGDRALQQRRPSNVYRCRDTLLYREIEDIIDCYAYPDETKTKTGTGMGMGMDIAEQGQRQEKEKEKEKDQEKDRQRADTVTSSYFADEPEAAQMRRRGFI
ncbi:hypothetical protein GL218_08143 [Daldinia childiae]|uniref:uncharacterized protein n=1 Tax=Daldinia childiae TaxID=326645 RepID=UPI0014463882|nr:uncharacterized protein GL218_08143 [Daldinia childiae]KAF3069024.1 hypothetical protein GL218_08143 [Daldinia childiae]